MALKVFGKRNRAGPTKPGSKLANTSGSQGTGMPLPKGQRVRPRRETWSSCTIFWPPGRRLKGICVDVSATGARVKLSENQHIPAQVRLVSAQLGLNREAALVRIDGLDAAFRFLDDL